MKTMLRSVHFIEWLIRRAVVLSIAFAAYEAPAQETPEKERTRMNLQVHKLDNGDRKIIAEVLAGRGKNTYKIPGAPIVLSFVAGDSTIEFPAIAANDEGTAELLVRSGYRFPADEDGFATIDATYDGNDSTRSCSGETLFKDLIIDLIPETVDSIFTVRLNAYETDPDGNKVPVEGLDIVMGVERLFKPLQVGEIQTDEDGAGSIEFPNDIPGDSTGALIIFAHLEENETYGSVTAQITTEWGLPVSYEVKPLPRQLWSNEAPLWMIFSVFLVLGAAWIHFILALNRLARVKHAEEGADITM